jgi:hypothetical protein
MPFRRVAIARLAAIFSEYEVCDFGHIADGDVHFNLVRRPGADYHPVRAVALHDRVLDIAVRDFGAVLAASMALAAPTRRPMINLRWSWVQRYSAAVAAVFAGVPAAAGPLWPAALCRREK